MIIRSNIMTRTPEIRCLRDYQLISIPSFLQLSSEEMVLVNSSLEKNYLKSPVSFGDTYEGYNFPIVEDDTLFFSHLYERYKEFSYNFFGNYHIAPQNQSRCLCYRSNKDWAESNWHNHLYSSTINGVYYHQVDGDGIFFERNGKSFHHVPQQGELLIFPNNLNHRPDMTTSQSLRYSINMEITTEESASTLFKNYGFS